MAFRRTSTSSDSSNGIKEELSSFARDAGSYLQARGELISIETQEASRILGKRLAFLVVAIVSIIITYLTVIFAITYLLGKWLDHLSNGFLANWAGAALIVAAGHLVLALVCLSRQKKIADQAQFFEYTRSEWHKDQQWIQNDEKPN